MARSGPQRPPVPLGAKQLEELALRYVGRYATSRAKLSSYLARKIRERGWGGEREPDVEALARRFCDLRYVDDSAYALMKSQSLSSRGYGRRRVDEKLRADGIGEEDSAPALDHADAHAVDAALRYARRRRIGPFATTEVDSKQREKAIAAMVRAGHSFALARKIACLPPGEGDEEMLRDELA
jgi:regulatory protein